MSSQLFDDNIYLCNTINEMKGELPMIPHYFNNSQLLQKIKLVLFSYCPKKCYLMQMLFFWLGMNSLLTKLSSRVASFYFRTIQNSKTWAPSHTNFFSITMLTLSLTTLFYLLPWLLSYTKMKLSMSKLQKFNKTIFQNSVIIKGTFYFW